MNKQQYYPIPYPTQPMWQYTNQHPKDEPSLEQPPTHIPVTEYQSPVYEVGEVDDVIDLTYDSDISEDEEPTESDIDFIDNDDLPWDNYEVVWKNFIDDLLQEWDSEEIENFKSLMDNNPDNFTPRVKRHFHEMYNVYKLM